MAERRMFSIKITESDAFLDMPLSAQALYFHLGMNADDDGFVNNSKKIKRSIGASDDDLKLLIAKRFLLSFPNGIVVIKHWKMNNYIQKDRYKPTVYQDEKNTLTIKENNSYTDNVSTLDTTWIQNGYNLDTQVSIGKSSIVKSSIVEDRKKTNYQEIIGLYNEICISFPCVKVLSEARKKAIKARLNIYTIEDFKTLFEKAEASDFLKGKNNHDWSANFDWLIADRNMAKTLDGNYDNKTDLSVYDDDPTSIY